jgi:hypothetical protein
MIFCCFIIPVIESAAKWSPAPSPTPLQFPLVQHIYILCRCVGWSYDHSSSVFLPLSLILGLIGKMFDSGRFNPTIPKMKTLFLCPCYFVEVWLILDLVGWLVGWLVVWWRVILSTITKWQMLFVSFRSLEVCHQMLFKVSIVSCVLVCLLSMLHLCDLEYKCAVKKWRDFYVL